jgi:hypothetical protein
MIKIIPILKRSWHILWSYRILWLFGILLVITAGGGPNIRSNSNSNVSYQSPATPIPLVTPQNAPTGLRDLVRQMDQAIRWFNQNAIPVLNHPLQHLGTILLIVGLVVLFFLLVGLLLALVRYPVETAILRMVDEYESSGQKLGFGKGWRLGWSRRAFNIWLIDLLLAIPGLVLVLLLFSTGLIALSSVNTNLHITSMVGIVAAIGLAFIAILLIFAVALFLSLVRNFFIRQAALEGLGAWESIVQGWKMVKHNWKSAGTMWLVMIGVSIVYAIIGMVAFFIFIPAYLVLLVPALLVAFLPGLTAFGITSIFTAGALPWIIGILFALLFFFLVLFSPLQLVGGWYKVFTSSVWTLTYREIKALQNHIEPAATTLPAES